MSLIDLTNVSELTVLGVDGDANAACVGGVCQVTAVADAGAAAEQETSRG